MKFSHWFSNKSAPSRVGFYFVTRCARNEAKLSAITGSCLDTWVTLIKKKKHPHDVWIVDSWFTHTDGIFDIEVVCCAHALLVDVNATTFLASYQPITDLCLYYISRWGSQSGHTRSTPLYTLHLVCFLWKRTWSLEIGRYHTLQKASSRRQHSPTNSKDSVCKVSYKFLQNTTLMSYI